MKVIVWHVSRELTEARGFSNGKDSGHDLAGLMLGIGEQASARKLFEARCYKPVAILTLPESAVRMESRYLDAMEEAFERTNHINDSWDSPQAAALLQREPGWRLDRLNEHNRSSMVGDVFEVVDGAVTELFVCSSFGFKKLNQPTEKE